MSNTNVSFTLTASDKTQAAFASVGNGLGHLENKSAALRTAFSGALIGGLASGLLGAGFTASVKRSVDDMDALSKAAQKVGVSVESLSALNFAGSLSDVSFDEMTNSLTRLSVKLSEAGQGTKDAVSLFQDLGINVKTSAGSLKSADVVLAEVATRFSQFGDGAEKTALAVDLFGKTGAKLIPLLNGGADGLAEMASEAKRLGLVFDGDLARQAEAFNDSLTRMGAAQRGFVNRVTAEMLPIMNTLADEMVGLSSGTDLASVAASSLTVLFQTLAVVGSDVAFVFRQTGTEIGGIAAQLAALARFDGKAFDFIGSAMKDDAKQARRELDAFQARIMGLSSLPKTTAERTAGPSGQAPKRTAVGATSANKKMAVAEASAEATAYGKAMEALAKLTGDAEAAQLDLSKSQRALLDLMSAPEWADMPETWKQTALAQFESAQAAELAADQQKRLNDLLGATETEKIEDAAKDMQLLAAALEKGVISAAQFNEAAIARLDSLGEKAKEATDELDEFAKSAAHNLQSTLADFIFDPFANGTKNMGQQFADMLRRMAAEAAAARIMSNLFGSMGQSTKSGGSGDWGWIGSAIGMVGSLFGGGAGGSATGLSSLPSSVRTSFDGGGFTGLGPRSGGVDGKGGFPALLHPNETVVDHAKGQRLGSSIVIHVNSQTGDKAEIRRSAAAGARAALGAMSGAQRYA